MEPLDLVADCGRCFALCCVAPAFAVSADFPIDKAAGEPCPNLAGAACSVHATLRPRGFVGCAVYDCFGAGQRISQLTFQGVDWRDSPQTASQMFAVLPVVRALHELLWYLREASALVAEPQLRHDLAAASASTQELAGLPAAELLVLDLATHRAIATEPLRRASLLLRTADGAEPGPDLSGADLVGVDLRGTDLRRASLRGTVLVGARLQQARLDLADLTGADLRGADLSEADLAGALFVTQAQLDAATGDPSTAVPSTLRRPVHWLAEHR